MNKEREDAKEKAFASKLSPNLIRRRVMLMGDFPLTYLSNGEIKEVGRVGG